MKLWLLWPRSMGFSCLLAYWVFFFPSFHGEEQTYWLTLVLSLLAGMCRLAKDSQLTITVWVEFLATKTNSWEKHPVPSSKKKKKKSWETGGSRKKKKEGRKVLVHGALGRASMYGSFGGRELGGCYNFSIICVSCSSSYKWIKEMDSCMENFFSTSPIY